MSRLISPVLRRYTLALALLPGVAPALAAQMTGTIRGRVMDAGTGRPVASASITVTGTLLGAITNDAGDFTLSTVPAGSQDLTARRIGYGRLARTVAVPAGGQVSADFDLRVTASTLDAVVVTGTGGAVEKRTLGNAITQLDVADLANKTSVVNVTEVLQSKTPGVTILPGSGVPGTAGEIRIRGASSLSGYKPVVFIDGIRFNIENLGGFTATGGGTRSTTTSTCSPEARTREARPGRSMTRPSPAGRCRRTRSTAIRTSRRDRTDGLTGRKSERAHRTVRCALSPFERPIQALAGENRRCSTGLAVWRER